MEGLSHNRMVFHSEADFQHALAWHIHALIPDVEIRLEYDVHSKVPNMEEKDEYADIWIKTSEYKIAIELKYVPRPGDIRVNGEVFHLRSHAHDIFSDIARLERWFDAKTITGGYAIFLTNDHLFWDPPTKKDCDDKFPAG